MVTEQITPDTYATTSTPNPNSNPNPTDTTTPLTPNETTLLSAFLSAQHPLLDLAAIAGVPLGDLLAWLETPRIQAAIATYRRLTDLALTLAGLRARATAIEALKRIVETSDNPIEQRRAATTLLRATAPPPSPRRTKPTSTDAPDTPAPHHTPTNSNSTSTPSPSSSTPQRATDRGSWEGGRSVLPSLPSSSSSSSPSPLRPPLPPGEAG